MLNFVFTKKEGGGVYGENANEVLESWEVRLRGMHES